MNNKTLSIVNILISLLLIVAVVFLFVNKPKTNSADSSNDEQDTSVAKKVDLTNPNDSAAINFADLKVVYVNTDTLWNQYEFVNNTLKSLEREQTRLQSAYESKMMKLEKDYTEYMEKGKANLLSLKQQQELEASLEKQQLEIKQLEDEVTNKLIIRKQELNQQINDTILAFLNRYREINGYDVIFQHSYLSGILTATPQIDITQDVVTKLNSEYRNFKK